MSGEEEWQNDWVCEECGWLWPYADDPIPDTPTGMCEMCGGDMREEETP